MSDAGAPPPPSWRLVIGDRDWRAGQTGAGTLANCVRRAGLMAKQANQQLWLGVLWDCHAQRAGREAVDQYLWDLKDILSKVAFDIFKLMCFVSIRYTNSCSLCGTKIILCNENKIICHFFRRGRSAFYLYYVSSFLIYPTLIICLTL